MADLAVSVVVSRTSLALADLQLENPGTYRVVALGPGALSWRREVAMSPYVHGETLVGAVKDVSQAILAVRVYAPSAALLWSRTRTLLDAFEQFSYTLTSSVDGQAFAWACEVADYAVGDAGVFQANHLRSFQQEVRFNIPRSPIPTSGAV